MDPKNVTLNSLSMLFFGAAVEQFHTNMWLAAVWALIGVVMQIAYDYLP